MATASTSRLNGEWWSEPRRGTLKGTGGQAAVEIWSGPRNLVDAEYVGTVAGDAAMLVTAAPRLLAALKSMLDAYNVPRECCVEALLAIKAATQPE